MPGALRCLAFVLERHVGRVLCGLVHLRLVAALQRGAHVVPALVATVRLPEMLALFLLASRVRPRRLHVYVHPRGVTELIVQLQRHLVLLLLLPARVLVLQRWALPLLIALLALVVRLPLAALPALQALVALYTLPLNKWLLEHWILVWTW